MKNLDFLRLSFTRIVMPSKHYFVLCFQDIEHYILIVSASDAGEPPLTATTTIYVNVKDVNDNPPDIEKSLYEINVAENVEIGTSILHVQVTDKDAGKRSLKIF